MYKRLFFSESSPLAGEDSGEGDSPVVHGNIEDEQKAIRAGLIQVLEGKRPIPMAVVNWPKGNES